MPYSSNPLTGFTNPEQKDNWVSIFAAEPAALPANVIKKSACQAGSRMSIMDVVKV